MKRFYLADKFGSARMEEADIGDYVLYDDAQARIDELAQEIERLKERPQEWTCFHCGETFTTPGGARDHFGAARDATPGCLLKVELGAERGLLMALRKAEEKLARYMAEDTALHRELHAMQSRHAGALITAEEAGYRRGLRDLISARREEAKSRSESLTSEHVCPECGGPLSCLGGASAHPDNWYCEDEQKCGWRAWENRGTSSK